MAQIVTQSFIITVSKLVKDTHKDDQILNQDQVHTILEALPSILEEIIQDDSVVIEASSP
jgi:2-hydroxy-3-keto-5-methylthiopentenyl-1-phosphate phosphatase